METDQVKKEMIRLAALEKEKKFNGSKSCEPDGISGSKRLPDRYEKKKHEFPGFYDSADQVHRQVRLDLAGAAAYSDPVRF